MEFSVGARNNSRSGRSGCSGRVVGTLFFGLFFLMGTLFVVLIIGEAVRATQPWFWRQVPCTIVASGVAETGDDESPYAPTVHYAYQLEGRFYESRRYARGDHAGASYDRARDRAARFEARSSAVCFVDPENPSLAVLHRSPPWIALTVFFPLIFVAIGGIGLWAIWRIPAGDDGSRTRSISQRAAGGRGHKLMLVLGAIFTVVGTATFVPLFALPMARLAAATTWKAVPCEVVAADLRSWSTDDGTSYRADVLYRYDIEGRSWRSNRVDFFSVLSSGHDTSRDVLAAYPVGTKTTCWVDPGDPSRSVLERRFRPRYLLGALTAIFLVAGLGLTRHGWKALRRVPVTTEATGELTPPATPLVLRPAVGPGGKVAAAFLFAVFWNGIVSVFVWQAWGGWQRGDPDWLLTLFLIPFVLVGLGAAGSVIYFLLATFNPRPEVTLLDGPLRLGQELRIGWRFSGRTSRIRRLTISLEGREEATYRRGTDTVTDRETFFSHTLVETESRHEIPRGQTSLAIPDDTMHSFDGANNKIIWALQVAGEIARWPDVDEGLTVTIAPLALEEV